MCVFTSFPFGLEMWDLIELIPDHCHIFTLNKYIPGSPFAVCFLLPTKISAITNNRQLRNENSSAKEP